MGEQQHQLPHPDWGFGQFPTQNGQKWGGWFGVFLLIPLIYDRLPCDTHRTPSRYLSTNHRLPSDILLTVATPQDQFMASLLEAEAGTGGGSRSLIASLLLVQDFEAFAKTMLQRALERES